MQTTPAEPMAEEYNKHPSRYEYMRPVSKTAQSSVWYVGIHTAFTATRKSRDTLTGKKVAVKEIDHMDDKWFSKRCLYEIKLLRHFNHENVRSLPNLCILMFLR